MRQDTTETAIRLIQITVIVNSEWNVHTEAGKRSFIPSRNYNQYFF